MSNRSYLSGAQKRKKAAADKQFKAKLPKLTNFITSSPSTSSSSSQQSQALQNQISQGQKIMADTEIATSNSLPLSECIASSSISADNITAASTSKEASTSNTTLSSFSTDPALWNVNNNLRSYFIDKGPDMCQNHEVDLKNSARNFIESNKNKIRYANISYFTRVLLNGEKIKREWLLYSPSEGTLYCFVCRLFSSKCLAFGTKGFEDWKHGHESICGHENSVEHRNCMLIYTKRKKEISQIDEGLIKQLKNEQCYWRELLKRIVAVIKFLASRGLAFRGSNQQIGSTQNGNYLGTLEFLGQFDPFLGEHLKKYGNAVKGTPSYLSANICMEFIALMSKKVLTTIINEIKTAKYYSISVDSSPDITHRDQLSFTVRYVKGSKPIERFLQFIEIHGHGAEYLTGIVIAFLQRNDIDIMNHMTTPRIWQVLIRDCRHVYKILIHMRSLLHVLAIH